MKSKNISDAVPVDLLAIVKTWPARVLSVKKATGKTQDDIAEGSGVSSGQLSQYLNGINSPNITRFELIENYLRRMGV